MSIGELLIGTGGTGPVLTGLLVLLGRALLITVLVAAAVSKFRDRGAFLEATRRLIPGRPAAVIRSAARIVLVVEVVTAGLLLLAPTAAVGALAAGGLMGAFTVAVVASVRRGSTEPCGCFGTEEAQPLGLRHVVRNLGLVLVAIGLVVTPASAPAAPAAALALGLGALLALLVIRLDDLLALFLNPVRKV